MVKESEEEALNSTYIVNHQWFLFDDQLIVFAQLSYGLDMFVNILIGSEVRLQCEVLLPPERFIEERAHMRASPSCADFRRSMAMGRG